MAHHDSERNTLDGVLDILIENGLEGMAEAMATMLNEAMKIERSSALRAEPGERCEERIGYASGFKPKRLQSRVGALELRIPQVRPLPGGEPVEFYPRALEVDEGLHVFYRAPRKILDHRNREKAVA